MDGAIVVFSIVIVVVAIVVRSALKKAAYKKIDDIMDARAARKSDTAAGSKSGNLSDAYKGK